MRTCPRFPLSCPVGCGEVNIPRESVNDHVHNYCPLADTICPFSNCGCSFKVRIDTDGKKNLLDNGIL